MPIWRLRDYGAWGGSITPGRTYKTHHDRRFRGKQDTKEVGRGGLMGGGAAAATALSARVGSRRMARRRAGQFHDSLFVSHHEEYVKKKMGKMGICCMDVLYNTERKGPVLGGEASALSVCSYYCHFFSLFLSCKWALLPLLF